MGPELTLTRSQNLKLYQPDRFNTFDQQPPKTPNEWFGRRYGEQVEKFGSPFLELVDNVTNQVLPIVINQDFFAGLLGGRRDLGHHTIYFEGEMQWYFKDSDGIFKPTTAEKLANLYRALLLKCAEQMPPQVHKLNFFVEFRSDKVAKAVTNRAKSILAADHTFFSATSSHQRIRGPELHERLARMLVEQMFEHRDNSIVTVTQAYNVFCQLSQQRNLNQLKRSMFREMMRDLVRDVHGLALRNDVPDAENHQQQGWKGLAVVEAEALATGSSG